MTDLSFCPGISFLGPPWTTHPPRDVKSIAEWRVPDVLFSGSFLEAFPKHFLRLWTAQPNIRRKRWDCMTSSGTTRQPSFLSRISVDLQAFVHLVWIRQLRLYRTQSSLCRFSSHLAIVKPQLLCSEEICLDTISSLTPVSAQYHCDNQFLPSPCPPRFEWMMPVKPSSSHDHTRNCKIVSIAVATFPSYNPWQSHWYDKHNRSEILDLPVEFSAFASIRHQQHTPFSTSTSQKRGVTRHQPHCMHA